jgi:hypothetical protein
MIEKDGGGSFLLSCDNCGEWCDEIFDTFYDAVAYKKDWDNGWRTVKDKDGDWQELCPACNRPEIIAKLKGADVPDAPRDELASAGRALKALEED